MVLYSDMLNVLHFSHSLCRNGLSRGNVSMYATFLLAENGVMMLLIKQKPLQAQRLYCLSNYRLPLCSVGAGQQKMALRWSPEQIAGRAKREKEPFSISFPTIYRAIDKGVLPPQLKKIMCFKWKHKK